MSDKQSPSIDRAGWGRGPWDGEPDRVEFEHAGLPCILRRHVMGHWCGYAAVPPGHALHGRDYNDFNLEVHGGLTYANRCEGDVCHEAKPGKPRNVWWFGFDCAHCWDMSPGIEAVLTKHSAHSGGFRTPHPLDELKHYRTLHYVRRECEQLAEQLAAWPTRILLIDSRAR